MIIKWKTLLVWLAVIVGVAAGVMWRHSERHRAPPPAVETVAPKPEVVVETKPPCHCKCQCPPNKDCECVCTCPQGHDPKAQPLPEKPKPVVKKPVPKKPAVKKPLDIRSNAQKGCEMVPRAAYEAPPDVVMEAARRRGLSHNELAALKRCIGGD